jgi:hypothetical protein
VKLLSRRVNFLTVDKANSEGSFGLAFLMGGPGKMGRWDISVFVAP